MNSFYYYAKCFCSFFGRNWRHFDGNYYLLQIFQLVLISTNHKIVSNWTVLGLVEIFLESQYFHWNSSLTERCAKVESFTNYSKVRNKCIWKMTAIPWLMKIWIKMLMLKFFRGRGGYVYSRGYIYSSRSFKWVTRIIGS